MNIKARLNIGSSDLPGGLLDGEVKDVSEAIAVRLVRMGAAVTVEAPPAPSEELKTEETSDEPKGGKKTK